MQLSDEQKQKALQHAESLAVEFDAQKAEEFAVKHQDANWYDDFRLLYRMITDDTYEVDTKTYLIIAGALAYVILPIDVIPDFIPIVGWLDDAFVLSYVINTLYEEIERYKAHLAQKGQTI